MRIRTFLPHDLAPLTELTIVTFGPFYDDSFRPLVGEAIFDNQHGTWRDDYRTQVAGLHDPDQNKHVAIAEADDTIAGYIAWTIDPERRNGRVEILAVAADHRRHGLATRLCRHAFDHMRAAGTEITVIGTGGDGFHAPARAFYESIGGTKFPVAAYYFQL